MCGNRLFNRKFVHLIDFNFSSFLVFLVCDLCSIFRICAFFFLRCCCSATILILNRLVLSL